MIRPTVARTDTDAAPREIRVGYVGDTPTTADEITRALENASDRLTVEPIADDTTALADDVTDRFDCIVGRVTGDSEDYPLLERAVERATERTLVKLMAKWVSYETEREQSRETLEAQNDRLQEFTSVVSHDLRNPLNVAQGALELAEDGDRSQLEACEEALDRMEPLIEELRSLAEQGATTAELEPVSVQDRATRAWSMVDTGGAVLELDGDQWVRADPDRLQQLLENLFRNALDHGIPEGGTSDDLTVAVGACEDADGFYVADTGRGIPADERDAVFDIGFTTAEDGTGFGLGIVERVADAHDWNLKATASESGGARFEVTGVARPRE